VQLDDPLLNYFKAPNTPAKLSDERFKKITVRMLLQHRSGLLTASDDPMTGPSPPCPRKTTRWIESHNLADDPGVKYSYSNMGYCLLGHVIESASGVGYEQYVQKMLFEIGANSVRMGKSEDSGIDEVIYYNSPDEARGAYNSFSLEELGSAGGLTATPSDLVKFADHIFGNKKSLLERKEIFLEIITPPAGITDRRFYGLGFNVVLSGQDSATIFHSGSLVGTSTFLAKYSNGWTIAAAFNRRKKDYSNLILSIDRALSNARNNAIPPDSTQELSLKYR
jgi:N-acyl-D-amino-acid deacylase